ncbi:MAG: internal scaffolding protein [Microviridae sp.]|nr:MAG: internal scaffolding protein [Microviridae sp.]
MVKRCVLLIVLILFLRALVVLLVLSPNLLNRSVIMPFLKPGVKRVRVYQFYDPDAPSMTDPSFRDQCDINRIVARYRNSNVPLPAVPPHYQYIDALQVPDFAAVQQTVVDARRAFDALDARIRARFAHDPAQLIAFVADERNYDEALVLGLVKPRPVPAPAPALAGESSTQLPS